MQCGASAVTGCTLQAGERSAGRQHAVSGRHCVPLPAAPTCSRAATRSRARNIVCQLSSAPERTPRSSTSHSMPRPSRWGCREAKSCWGVVARCIVGRGRGSPAGGVGRAGRPWRGRTGGPLGCRGRRRLHTYNAPSTQGQGSCPPHPSDRRHLLAQSLPTGRLCLPSPGQRQGPSLLTGPLISQGGEAPGHPKSGKCVLRLLTQWLVKLGPNPPRPQIALSRPQSLCLHPRTPLITACDKQVGAWRGSGAWGGALVLPRIATGLLCA